MDKTIGELRTYEEICIVFTGCHRCDCVYRFLSAVGYELDYDSIGSGSSVTHAIEKPSQDDRWRSTEVIG
jgi:hypothetical protein